MKQRKIIPLFIVLLATLACTIFVGGPEAPGEPIPISTEAVTSLQEQIKAAVESGVASGGVVTLLINETQLTSYLALKNADDPSPMFTEPQVYLRDGQMRIYGKTQQGSFVANIGIVLAVGLDEEGLPQLQLVSADFGPFPLPEGLNDAITAIIEEAYTGSLGPVATGFRLQSITIADGVMTVVGQVR